MFPLIDKTIDISFSINWKNYFDRSILVISMTVLPGSATTRKHDFCVIFTELFEFFITQSRYNNH